MQYAYWVTKLNTTYMQSSASTRSDSNISLTRLPEQIVQKPLSVRRTSRTEQADYLSRAQPNLSQRGQARQLGISRGRLRHWQKRQRALGAPLSEVAFFESPEGVAFLHRLVTAIHIGMTLEGSGGIRQVCKLLERSGLSRHVASSYGAQQAFNATLEENIVIYGKQQHKTLGQAMPARDISVGEDETYHPQPCLVALEPVSGFILLERYADDRSAKTWNEALEEAIDDLPVKVIQSTSDEAKGLISHARHLEAHHSPDLFHIQHDLVKGSALALKRVEKQAETALVTAQESLAKAQRAKAYFQQKKTRGRPSKAYEQAVKNAEIQVLSAEVDLEQAQQNRQEARQTIRDMSAIYHPYHLDTGVGQSPEVMQTRLNTCWDSLDRLTRKANLSERCQQLLDKAKSMTQAMLLTLQFFIATCQFKLGALDLPEHIEVIVRDNWIPALYLQNVAQRCGKPEERRRLQLLAAQLMRPVHQAEGPIAALSEAERQRIEEVATECAHLFQRSSSAVEGRNGQLSLHHHRHHRLSDRKLGALTVIHNYLIERCDNSTAAQRFFGHPPDDLFDWLMAQTKPPGRPAQKRAPYCKIETSKRIAA